MRGSWPALSVGVMMVALTGCATDEQPGPPPASAWSAPPVHYSGLSGECPTLTSPESERFTGSRKGRLLPLPRQQDAFEWINCSWRPPAGAPWVNLVIRIHRDGFAPTRTGHGNADLEVTRSVDHDADRARTNRSGAIRAAGRTTPSGRAALLADGAAESLSQSTAIGNVVVTVMLIEAKTRGANVGARADGLMAELAATSEAITAEIAGQLVIRQ